MIHGNLYTASLLLDRWFHLFFFCSTGFRTLINSISIHTNELGWKMLGRKWKLPRNNSVENLWQLTTVEKFQQQKSPNFLLFYKKIPQFSQFLLLEFIVCLQLCFSICPNLKMEIHDAAENGNLGRVRLLVEQGVDKDKGNSLGNTPLRQASSNGHLEVVQYLVEQGASLDKGNEYDHTPLSGAAYFGHLEVARYLLEQGADRDKASNDGWTPLHWAAREVHLEIAMLLMSYGADLNARTKWNELPIDVARTETIKQAIRDEPRRRMDHGHKRATEQDRHPNAAASASAQQEEEEEDGEEQSNKRQRLDEGAVAAVAEAEETKVAEEDEDSEPSSDDEEEDD